MSRIQHILNKAEREGSLLRMRSMTEPAATAALAFESPSDPEPEAGTEDIAAAPAASALTPGRTVRGAELDPIVIAALAPGTPTAEQYRTLRTRVTQTEHPPANVILVTSPGRGEGKSLMAANLGLTMAQDLQSRICIVDADLRRSKLHLLFGLPDDAPGLADVLAGRAILANALTGLEDQQITVLPAGQLPAHPAELLGSSAMRRTIQTLRTQFDRVIIDAPPAAPLADIGILTPLVDSVLLVVRADVTTKPAIQDAVATIGPEKLLGVVLNDAASRA
jgi:capsular exopolysaccharide synthesis family protein